MEFETWYRAEHPRLVAWLAVAAGDVEAAKDASSEAFSRAFARWGRVSRMASPTGWTYTVALNVLRRHLRRRALEERLLRHHAEPTTVQPAVVSPEVWRAVRLLPMRQRTAIALRYVLDLSQAEIGDVMGIAPGTVSATLAVARARLAVVLGESHEHEEQMSHDAR